MLIEVKVSRADFLAGARKEHRIKPALGAGKWRYFMCPEGLINVDEVPERWGLLWVSDKGTGWRRAAVMTGCSLRGRMRKSVVRMSLVQRASWIRRFAC
ncbi:hypothetical protein [Xanthomonas campestris]|uniref:hypothetical protein n=1 Tax=Xanthomonas campestris TaxID=339 RepID=UPI000C287461|nr:hypothetical protein [Xanthomonas campestris]MCD0261509.1 hypothetical protein [Xanthomonas campestris pv. campestris]MCD0270181.1 hypothetical protein [Xanthomonas campestris pv. campestris]